MKVSKKIRNTILIISIVTILLLLVSTFLYIKTTSTPKYIGKDITLLKIDENTSNQIDNVVMKLPPKVTPGVQEYIQITKFTGNYAQGIISYSDKSATQHFIAAKANKEWVIITHNSGKKLYLPDIKTAEKYSLPKGWYTP